MERNWMYSNLCLGVHKIIERNDQKGMKMIGINLREINVKNRNEI